MVTTALITPLISCNVLDCYKNALALLFLMDVDEKVYDALVHSFPGWVDRAKERSLSVEKSFGNEDGAGNRSAEDAKREMYETTIFRFLLFPGCRPNTR
eukprot:3937004-Prymnesium_polylepis.1